MIIYIIEALRWGNRENHSYVVGCCSTPEKAKEIKDREEEYRGGKYECEIREYILDETHEEKSDRQDKIIKEIAAKIKDTIDHRKLN